MFVLGFVEIIITGRRRGKSLLDGDETFFVGNNYSSMKWIPYFGSDIHGLYI